MGKDEPLFRGSALAVPLVDPAEAVGKGQCVTVSVLLGGVMSTWELLTSPSALSSPPLNPSQLPL